MYKEHHKVDSNTKSLRENYAFSLAEFSLAEIHYILYYAAY